MNLPPLPLIDGCLFIDNSGWIEGINTCYRYVENRMLRARIPTVEKPAANFGSAIHLAIEYRHKHYGTGPVDDAFYEAVASLLTKFFDDHPPANDDWRNLNWAMLIIRKYMQRYPREDFNLLVNEKGEPLVEQTFAVPLFTWRGEVAGTRHAEEPPDYIEIPVIYTGRIDLPISIDGRIHIMDHKTASSFHFGPALGSKSFFDDMRRSSQQRGYCWAFEQVTGMKVSGYYINAIKTAEPPMYVLENGTSSHKNFEGKKQTASEWWDASFQREHYEWNDSKAAEWKRNTIDLVEEFFWHYQRDYMPEKTSWCTAFGKCPYYDVCQLRPEDRGIYLASGLFTDNKWTPLKQPSQVKQ